MPEMTAGWWEVENQGTAGVAKGLGVEKTVLGIRWCLDLE